MLAPSLTIGIEEEYQILDPRTGELAPSARELLADGDRPATVQLSEELHQSMVELGTSVCKTPAEAREELVRSRKALIDLARRHNLEIAAAGSHPYSAWEDQMITPSARYLGVKADMADLAQQLLIFGTHVHVGIEDRDFLIDCMNVARYFIPHILCLSTSSPFWNGRNTGLKSYRSVIFRNLPRSGIPRVFDSWADYHSMLQTMIQTHCVADGSRLWYDLRPSWRYRTLEFRSCDVCTTIDESICVAALFQALIAKLWKLRRDNLTFRVYPSDLIEENKWRAVRFGLDGKLLDLGRRYEVPARDLIHELIDWFLRDVIDELGTRKEIEYAYTIMKYGSSADRQIAVFDRSGGDIHAVVNHLIRETADGVEP